MEEKNDHQMGKVDEEMLPGFRFHPTDEELVGFYLKRKIQQRLLPIELIKQVDIYKYDPWDLPKLASTGEKEWYFYCPRDRKYRNSARPNRVTGAGFWKATGTDRPIYSSESSKCIGLKKSLVFYRGRAAKGLKTDWMMHEFRLPSIAADSSSPSKKLLDKSLPPNDAWAICRIFKKTSSMAQRALSQSWLSSLPAEPTSSGFLSQFPQFGSENDVSCTTDLGSSAIQFWSNNNDLQHQQPSNYSAFNSNRHNFDPALVGETIPNGFMFAPTEMSSPPSFNHALVGDLSNNISGSIDFQVSQQQQLSGFSTSLAHQDQNQENTILASNTNTHWETIRSIGFPFSLGSDDSSDMSTSYFTN